MSCHDVPFLCLIWGFLFPSAALAEQAVPILTYHAEYTPDGDMAAFRADLRILDQEGFQIVPLSWVVDWVHSGRPIPERAVALTVDDGLDPSYLDLGDNPSLLTILTDFQAEVGVERQPWVHMTLFVIASATARAEIEGWPIRRDFWWRTAAESPLIDIGNHSWDHNHPHVTVRCDDDPPRHGFRTIDTYAEATCAIAHAAATIHRITDTWPTLFSYPYGEASPYLREDYFPSFLDEHRTRAAMSTTPQPVTRSTSPWFLPRYVYGRDWKTPEGLRAILPAK